MPLSLKETCYLSITENVKSEKHTKKCEKHDQQHLWRGASATLRIIPANAVAGTTFLLVKTQGGV